MYRINNCCFMFKFVQKSYFLSFQKVRYKKFRIKFLRTYTAPYKFLFLVEIIPWGCGKFILRYTV